MRYIFLIFTFSFFLFNAQSQEISLYPTNWFTNMKWNNVQILVHSKQENFNQANVSITYPGVTLLKINKLENAHYYALDILVSPIAKAGNVDIVFGNSNAEQIAKWPLLNRRAGKGESFAQGVTAKDVMYLLMPDRFSNGDKSNDRIAGMLDQSLNREAVEERHGGDLQGVINKLDYLKDLGVTAVWMTPIWENNMPNRTEHGYAITNHYKVDPRHGTNKTYELLGSELHKRGMKLVQDVVYNHVGLGHFFYKDKPMSSWFHNWDSFTQTTYKDQTLFDPYAAAADVKK